MSKQELSERLALPEYDFLRTSPQFSNPILYCIAGSRAHGTDIEGSDWDIRGVVVEPKDVLFGLQSFEQYTDTNTDTVIFGLKKFCQLALKANPNVLDILFCEHTDTLYSLDGNVLRQYATSFLSKRITSTTLGCVKGNRHRIDKAIEKGEIIKANKYLMHSVRLLRTAIFCHQSYCYLTYGLENWRQEYIDIREGKLGVTYGDWKQRLDVLENELKEADKKSVLPDEPDVAKIHGMMYQIYQRTFT